jgi:hypothetical protein
VSAGPSFGRRVVTAPFVGAVASAEVNGAAPTQYVYFDPAWLNLHAVARWEWRRGSALYLVWTQRRAGSATLASARVSQLLQPFEAASANAVMAKLTCWIGR